MMCATCNIHSDALDDANAMPKMKTKRAYINAMMFLYLRDV